jgi:signal transduction histidine kinase
MRTLRLRIAAILVGAIVVVVLVATFVVTQVVERSNSPRMIWPVAGQIIAIDSFYTEGIGGTEGPLLDAADNVGAERPDLTAPLRDRLAEAGVDLPVTVYDKGDDAEMQIAVIELSGRRLGIEFPVNMPIPQDLQLALASWVSLIVLGVIVVSLLMAYRVTQPFAILEQAVSSIGGDGVLPHIPETGSGEARQTAAVLNRLAARLRGAMESRMRLVAAAGHDLRTPMTRMRIRAEFLDDEDRTAWLKDLDELELIADSAIRLVKEEVSTDDHEPVALDRMVSETVDELQAQHYAIKAAFLDRAVAKVPALAMKRALRNLLINAATHGKGGTVSLRQQPDGIVIEIRDTGPGIPQDLLVRVFEPFFRAEPGRVQTTPGAGLGLAIAKEIIERSGGELSLGNDPAGGLTQRIVFPAASA